MVKLYAIGTQKYIVHKILLSAFMCLCYQCFSIKTNTCMKKILHIKIYHLLCFPLINNLYLLIDGKHTCSGDEILFNQSFQPSHQRYMMKTL